jgi:hypothetical protein
MIGGESVENRVEVFENITDPEHSLMEEKSKSSESGFVNKEDRMKNFEADLLKQEIGYIIEEKIRTSPQNSISKASK